MATLSPLATLSKPIAVLSPSAALLTPTAVLPPRARAAVVSELSSTAKYGEPPAAAREALSWATLTASVSLTPAATCDRRRLRSVASVPPPGCASPAAWPKETTWYSLATERLPMATESVARAYEKAPSAVDCWSAALAPSPMLTRSEAHTYELQSLMRISYAVF